MDKEPNDRDVISVNPEVIPSMRRNSTRKTLSLSSIDGKIISRYLRPSLGSCHDFCKYGRKDAAEAESKHPFFRRSLPNIIVKHEEKNKVESLKFGERRRQVIERRTSSQLKFEFSNTPEVNKKGPSPANGSVLFQKHVNVKLRTPSFPHKSTLSAKPAILQTSSENEMESVHLGEKVETKKGRFIKPKTKLHQKESADQSKVIEQQDKSLANKTNAAVEPDIIDKNTALHVKKSAASVKPWVFKKKTLSSVKESIATTKSQVLKQKASSHLKRVDLSAKPAISLKKTTAVKCISILNPLCSLTGRRNQEAKVIKSMGISKIGEKKVLKPSTYSSSPKTPVNGVLSINPRKYRNVKFASPMKSQGKIRKTEHDSDDVKEPKSENIELDPILQNSKNYQSYPSMSYTECQDEFSKVEDKRRHRRTATVHPVGSLSNPHKLRFRRGKVLDIQPQNNGPRRLRFKKGRIVVPNPKGYVEVGAGSVRRGELDNSVSNDPGSEALVVQLKHQDMLGKKDSQGLFNHVIEETATKLVETRKSKVKALVGAFETVISLQESKPASAI